MGKPKVHPKRVAKIDAYYRQMSEAIFQAHVIQIAVEKGFVLPPIDPDSKKIIRRRHFPLVYYTYSSRRSAPASSTW